MAQQCTHSDFDEEYSRDQQEVIDAFNNGYESFVLDDELPKPTQEDEV